MGRISYIFPSVRKIFAMKMSCLTILFLVILICSCDQHNNGDYTNQKNQKYTFKPSPDFTQPKCIYIPRDYKDCILEMEIMLQPELLKEIKESREQDLVKYNKILGKWMIDNWGLRSGSRLRDFLIEQGFWYPDEMSSAIIRSFWNRFNGETTNIVHVSKLSEYHCIVTAEPDNPICPLHNAPIKIVHHFTDTVVEGNTPVPVYIHVGRCTDKNEIWIYDIRDGWRQPDDNLKQRINELEKNGGL